MELDLGDVVKECAVGRGLAILYQNEVKGLVNLARDIRVTGLQPDDTARLVGIRGSLQQDKVVAWMPLVEMALATMSMLMGKDAESWLASLGVPFLLFDQTLTVHGTFNERLTREVL